MHLSRPPYVLHASPISNIGRSFNNELEVVWKEVVYPKVLARYVPVGTEENQKNVPELPVCRQRFETG
jgi:hypothetical protein